jgi:Na+-translocating ferredoxin:NAD+ oxidoreductase subunit G
MAKLKSSITNMMISLTAISIVMSASLGFVYIKTKGPIEKAKEQKVTDAIALVVPPFNNDPVKEMINIDGCILYPARKDGNLAGVAVKSSSPKGFGGAIYIMVGFLPDGTIQNISVLDQKETPGLGTKMTEPKFKDQFKGKNPDKYKLMVKKDGGDVDAITASTITSKAFSDAVQNAYNAFKKGGLK